MPVLNTELHYLTQDELARLLSKTIKDTARNHAIFTVAYWHGLRASEVGRIRSTDWHPDTNRLYVRRLKGSNSGEYIVGSETATALKSWMKVRGTDPGPLFVSMRGGAPISRQRLHNLMVGYCAQAGIAHPKNHFHVLRHSVAVHMADKGIDVAKIQDWLGHKSLTSTMVYVVITNKARHDTAGLLYGGRGITVTEEATDQGKVKVNWKKDKQGAVRK